MIKHFRISTCDSLPKATYCTLAREGGGSATFWMERNIKYKLKTMPLMKIHSLGKNGNPTFWHCAKVLTKQSERHHIERESRGKTWTLLYRSKTGTDNEPQALAFKPKKERSQAASRELDGAAANNWTIMTGIRCTAEEYQPAVALDRGLYLI